MKLKRYTTFEHINLRGNPKKAVSPAVQMQAEALNMLALLRDRDLVIALDERGKACTSFDFANLLALAGMSHCSLFPGWHLEPLIRFSFV
jgi:23S rRNA pseudoU1915 N3-methylase RlmH